MQCFCSGRCSGAEARKASRARGCNENFNCELELLKVQYVQYGSLYPSSVSLTHTQNRQLAIFLGVAWILFRFTVSHVNVSTTLNSIVLKKYCLTLDFWRSSRNFSSAKTKYSGIRRLALWINSIYAVILVSCASRLQRPKLSWY